MKLPVGSDLARAAQAIAQRGGRLGQPLHLLSETTSTNDEAKLAARAGASHGATWVAEVQRAGRGRQGRVWIGAAGEALLFSVLFRLASASPARLPPLALVAGLAARDAIARALPGTEVMLKWPNDVVVRGRKIAGVLVEASLSGGRADSVVIGIGINVHTRIFSDELSEVATSLALLGAGAPDRAALLADVLYELDREIAPAAAGGLGLVHARLSAVDALRGKRVRGELGDGTAEGIDVEGRLVVRADDGRLQRWGAGEVHLLR